MDDREGWRERVTEIRTGSATWRFQGNQLLLVSPSHTFYSFFSFLAFFSLWCAGSRKSIRWQARFHWKLIIFQTFWPGVNGPFARHKEFLWVSFCRRDCCLCIYHLSVGSTFNLLRFLWITFPTQFFYYICLLLFHFCQILDDFFRTEMKKGIGLI